MVQGYIDLYILNFIQNQITYTIFFIILTTFSMFIDTSTAFFMEIKCLHLNEYQYCFFFTLLIFLAFMTRKKTQKKILQKNTELKWIFFVLMNMGVIFLEFWVTIYPYISSSHPQI